MTVNHIRQFSRRMSHLCVCGGGQMGIGIALKTAIETDRHINVVEPDSKSVSRAKSFVAKLDKQLEKLIVKHKLSQSSADNVKERLKFCPTIAEAIQDTDFFIEAVPEVLPIKKKVLEEVAELSKNSSFPIATNTSSISITHLASFIPQAAQRVIGVHFFNPVLQLKGVEIIAGLCTDEQTKEKAHEFVNSLGKVISVSDDRKGFIANKLLIPYINSAVLLLQNNVAPLESIDNIMIHGCNMPMGPLALADLIGLDTVSEILNVLGQEPCELLTQYVNAGWLGRKSGRGFYVYSKA